jgi:hypothetical protein
MLTLKSTIATAVLFAVSFASSAELIGQWTFDDTSDSTGNFADLTLREGAVVDDGKLDLSATGLQWANTVWADSSDVTVISDKTLVSWVELSNLYTRTGSALTIDSATVDNFNGLIWSEGYFQKWQIGSTNGRNNVDLGSDASGTLGVMTQVAASFDVEDDNVTITYYIDGIDVGSYTSSNTYTWSANDAEIIFGARHSSGTTGAIAAGGGLDGFIYEAHLYDNALSQSEIQALTLTEVTINDVPITAFGISILASGFMVRRRSTKRTERKGRLN